MRNADLKKSSFVHSVLLRMNYNRFDLPQIGRFFIYITRIKAALMDSLLSYDIRFGLQCVNVECE